MARHRSVTLANRAGLDSSLHPRAMKKFKPGDRVIIAAGPGAGIAGVVVEPGRHDRQDATKVTVIFDREPGVRYSAFIAGLDFETVPKKPPKPSVRRIGRRRRA